MKSLLIQLDYELERFKNEKIETIFIGGGTPSSVEPYLFEEIFSKIKSRFLNSKIEITTEANPNSASNKWLKEMFQLGINRLSLGVQSFDNFKLKNLGRNHNQIQAIQSIENAKKIGFQNISIDLIYNTVWDSKKLLLNDLEIVKNLEIQHLSAYSLTIEENTPFTKTPNVNIDNLELSKLFIEKIHTIFTQYEISNFGKKSLHNYGYWQQKNYIGIGAGAVGFLEDRRFYPQSDIHKYIQNPLEIKAEDLTQEDLKTEKLFLGFRSDIGVEKSFFKTEKDLKTIQDLKDVNIIFEDKNRIYNKNYFLSDEVALKFL